MDDFILYIGTAIALILIIEGLLYALFTKRMRQILAQLIVTDPRTLKIAGITSAILGVFILMLIDFLTTWRLKQIY